MNHNVIDPLISIGTLAEKVGLSVSAIRKYEIAGLIISRRTDSGHRMFSYEDITRIRVIQHMIKNIGFNAEGIRRLQALLPCWDLLPCNNDIRDECPAFKDNSKPCWMLKDAQCTQQGNQCRCCIVYRFGSLCIEDIKELLHNQTEMFDPKEFMIESLHNKQAYKEEEK
jgi:MerR family transcriptional regulator/heat shock protein HspR